ncbi:tRNA 2-thiouridine(34) synthase MnmA [Thermoleophilia bacterium SCSIO 60948]|nr:tRNA 2-thiouridine(34) synthase MnmA [Thermoleophilia bacterium SCSIO 60948]
MDAEALDHYLRDRSRRGPAHPGSLSGSSGGSICGDEVRISLGVDDAGRVADPTFEADGCAALRAAAAATCELVDGADLLDAARVSPETVAGELGGLSAQGEHAAVLVADALHRALSAWASSGRALAPLPANGRRVAVAMSGGVDSSAATLLEARAGAEVVAITVKLWADERNDEARSCCSPLAVRGARSVAHSLGLPHLTLDLESIFRERVVGDFIDGHRRGRTPNPCVLCNGSVRIDAMLALGERLGAEALATGHYARLERRGEEALLAAPRDDSKDQTYMLSGISPRTLARMRFPLADLRKPEVRALAAEAGLAVASKAESQDLCFLAGEGKRGFLARHGGLADTDGEIVDRSGERVGTHHGHQHFTVGQRRGIGVAAAEPLYVLGKDAERNRVVVGAREELEANRVRLSRATLHRAGAEVDRVRLRYRSRPLACSVEGDAAAGRHDELALALDEPAFGVAPGQTACLMSGELVVGSATIVA